MDPVIEKIIKERRELIEKVKIKYCELKALYASAAIMDGHTTDTTQSINMRFPRAIQVLSWLANELEEGWFGDGAKQDVLENATFIVALKGKDAVVLKDRAFDSIPGRKISLEALISRIESEGRNG